MKSMIILTLILLTLSHASTQIIVSRNCEFESISKSDIKKLFLVKKTSINEEKVIVLDTNEHELYSEFVKEYLNKSVRKVKTYWIRMIFTGKTMPPKKVSLDVLKELNPSDICHISYIDVEETVPSTWKMITVQ
jgi:hypothetical protein